MTQLSQANGTTLWESYSPFSSSISWATLTLSSSTTKAGAQGRAPKTGNISQIACYVTTVTGTPTLDARMETLTAAWVPSGTLLGTNSNITFAPTANSINILTLTTAVAVTAGDLIGAVIGYSSGSTSAILQHRQTGPFARANPSACTMSAGTWALNNQGTCCVIPIYDDGTWAWRSIAGTNDDFTFADSSNPDEYGNSFAPIVNCDCVGAQVNLRDFGTGTCDIKLYDSGSTLLASASHATAIGSTPFIFQFSWAPISLTAGSTYYLAVKATNANNVVVYGLKVGNSGGVKTWISTGAKVTRNNSGSWTSDDTRLMDIIPLVTTYSGSSGVAAGSFIKSGSGRASNY